MATLKSAAPQFLVDDLAKALAYYEERLGFACDFVYEGFHASVSRDGVPIHLKCAPKLEAERTRRRAAEHLDAYLDVAGAHDLYQELKQRGARIAKSWREAWWAGLRSGDASCAIGRSRNAPRGSSSTSGSAADGWRTTGSGRSPTRRCAAGSTWRRSPWPAVCSTRPTSGAGVATGPPEPGRLVGRDRPAALAGGDRTGDGLLTALQTTTETVA
jgi:uncharacterized glyoxalase superfamily protein PhnB